MSSISGIQAISIFDREAGSATEGTVVQKNRIVSNQGEAILQNMLTEEDAQGFELHAADESMFEFACYDTDGDDQLEAWAKTDKLVELVSAGLQENVLWYEPATIKIVKPFSFATKNRNYRRIKIQKSGGLHKCLKGINLLDMAVKLKGFETGWQDSNADDLADGYTYSTLTRLFENGVQQLTAGENTRTMMQDFAFPISGIEIYSNTNVLSQTANKDLFQAKVISRSFADAILSESQLNLNVGNTNHISSETPAQVFNLQYLLLVRATAGNQFTAELNDLTYRVDPSYEYVNY